MLHVLAGALAGAVIGAASAIAVTRIARGRLTWQSVVAAAAGGAVGGAITAATLGGGGVVAATATRAFTAYVAGGAGGGATNRVVTNFFDDQPLTRDLPVTIAVGAAAGGITYGAGRVLEPVVSKAIGVLPGVRAVDENVATLNVPRVVARVAPGLASVPASPAAAAHHVVRSASLGAAVTGLRTVAGYVLGGTAGGVSRTLQNALEHRPLTENLRTSIETGATTGAVGAGLGRVAQPVVNGVVGFTPPDAASCTPRPCATAPASRGLAGTLDTASSR